MFPVPLICPCCRNPQAQSSFELEARGALLCCSNPQCRRRFPGEPLPLVVRDLSKTTPGWPLARLAPEAELAWLDGLPEESGARTVFQRLATYGWTHYRDFLPPGVTPPFITAPTLSERLAVLLDGAAGPSLVLGSGAGRLALELARRGVGPVVALDLDYRMGHWFQGLLQRGEEPALPLMKGAVYWEHQHLRLPAKLASAASEVAPICADALEPPFTAGGFATVVVPNLVDNVADPLNLLAQADALVAAGGQLLVASPFAWQAGITPRSHQLEALSWADADGAVERPEPAEVVIGLLTGRLKLAYPFELKLVSRATLPWHLRVHGRQLNAFCCEVLHFHKA